MAPRSVSLSYSRAREEFLDNPQRGYHLGVYRHSAPLCDVSVTKVRIVTYRNDGNKHFYLVICARNWGPQRQGVEPMLIRLGRILRMCGAKPPWSYVILLCVIKHGNNISFVLILYGFEFALDWCFRTFRRRTAFTFN